ncbi:NTHL1 family protein [Megaselia abdita]
MPPKRLKLAEKLKISSFLVDKEELTPRIVKTSESPYFSPIKTRNKRQAIRTVEKEELPSTSKVIPELKKSKPISKKVKESGICAVKDIEDWEPPNWKTVLENIRKMRVEKDAPVDTMGCHKCADEDADDKTRRYQCLVSLMLSSQTKDQVNYEAMSRLKAENLTPDSIIAMDLEKLENLIKPVSFYRMKAKHMKATSQILIDQYNSDIPDNVKDLCKLPGVGPKMAMICMSAAWNVVSGIGVDVHVHRISNRLKWVQNSTKQPEQTRVALEKWIPKDLWGEVNVLLVGFGQTICNATSPRCGQCLNKDICPSASVKIKKIKKIL